MKRLFAVLACVVLPCAAGAAGRGAGSRPSAFREARRPSPAAGQVVVVPQGFVVTEFAVPVGVPVAPRSYVHYGLEDAPAADGREPRTQHVGQGTSGAVAFPLPRHVIDEIVARVVAELRAEGHGLLVEDHGPQTAGERRRATGAGQEAAGPLWATTGDPRPISLVQRTCLECHGGENPEANLSLADPALLTADQRLRAIGRLLEDDQAKRMPKGSTLSPEELGRIIQELSSTKGE